MCYGTRQAVGLVFYMASMLLFHNPANPHRPTKDTISVLQIKEFDLFKSNVHNRQGKKLAETQERQKVDFVICPEYDLDI